MAIRILDAATVGHIAAGEVVERPASAVKELFENALDAGATGITVEIRGGGVEYLRVTDNGCGIPPGEVRLAFQNHATSKLTDAEQLKNIRTLGFRGEALPSIAAVARVECTTRQKGAPSGVRLTLEGGRVTALEDAGCPEGTTLVVRDLFFNTPARLAFLKKPAYEAGVVVETVSRLLLANPQVAVKLINGGKTVFQSYGDGNLRHAALAVYGRQVAAALTPVDLAQGALRVQGLIGVGDCARPTRAQQSLFINGRVVRCPLVQQALENACRGRVTIGMHPMCMLALTMPPTAVDVNVHPNKLEVRFRDEIGVRLALDALFAQVFASERLLDLEKADHPPVAPGPQVQVRRIDPVPREGNPAAQPLQPPPQADAPASAPSGAAGAAGAAGAGTTGGTGPAGDKGGSGQERGPAREKAARRGPVPDMAPIQEKKTAVSFSPGQQLPLEIGGQGGMSLRDGGAPGLRLAEALPAGYVQSAGHAQPEPVRGEKQTEEKPESVCSGPAGLPFRVVGVLFRTYVLVETQDAFILIDQHAAHERILYEKYAPLLDKGGTQRLLTPMILPVSAKEMAQIEEQAELLASAGYEVEPFGEGAVAVRGVPFLLGQAELRPLFLEMLDRLDQLKYATQERRRMELIQTSCKHAVKGGDPLTQEEIAQLLRTMLDTQSPSTCPHGRPVARSFTRGELERMFKRQQ